MTVPDSASDPPTSGRKAVLICQCCGHESHVQGDWTWFRRGDLETIRCPQCGHEVAHRPCSDDDGAVPRRRCEPQP